MLSLLIFLVWLGAGFFVVQFVRRTGGHTPIGHVAHWFGGAFVMIGLAIGLVWILSQVDADFGHRTNMYVLTHQIRPGGSQTLIERHSENSFLTVYRRGSFNTSARLFGNRLLIHEQNTIRTSWWWMLWGSSRPD